MKNEIVLIEKKGEVAFVYLNRIEYKNAINPELLKCLYEKLNEIEKNKELKIIILTSKADVFCAGADLKWVLEEENFLKDAELLFDILYKIFTFPKIFISAVNGSAFGGALGLISASDIAIGSEAAKFAFSEVRLGIAPFIISPFVLNKLRYGWAREKFLTGKIFSAKEAVEAGLLDAVYPEEIFLRELEKLVEELLKGSFESQLAIKELFIEDKKKEILKKKERLCKLLDDFRKSEEAKKRIKEFLEKK